MKTYIYKSDPSPVRGYNLRVTVYRVKRNVPIKIGCNDYNTAAYKGIVASAKNIISEVDGIKMLDGYNLSVDIQLFAL